MTCSDWHLRFVAVIFFTTPLLAQDQLTGLPPRAAPTTHIQMQPLAVVDATPKFDARRATRPIWRA